MQIKIIRKMVESDKIVWTQHVQDRMKERDISFDEIQNGILNGEIIEAYPNDHPFPSCLIWAKINELRVIHIVVAYSDVSIYVISVYEPDESKFEENFKVRRTK